MEELLKIAMRAAVDAGAEILRIYAMDFEVEFKADESPLTTADKAAHEIIVRALEHTPYPVLSEESAAVDYSVRREWKQYWLVDPLDGTKEFIKKNGEFTVNIALIENGTPIMGVVYAPVLETLYYGGTAEGLEPGAWKAKACSGKLVDEIRDSAIRLNINQPQTPNSQLQTSNPKPPTLNPQSSIGNRQSSIPNLKVVASKSHCSEETVAFIEDLESEFGPAERVSMGSSLKLCMVADGQADIYPRIAPTMEWDTAAADAVVRAAGGRVVEFDPTVPAVSFLRGKWDVGSRMSAVGGEGNESATLTSHFPPPTSHIQLSSSHLPPSTAAELHSLYYNKENLLNPFFVVC